MDYEPIRSLIRRKLEQGLLPYNSIQHSGAPGLAGLKQGPIS
jgi:hypothetical protein